MGVDIWLVFVEVVMHLQQVLLASLLTGAYGRPQGKVENLIVFGDSYTDEGRLSYFFSTGGVPPPPGYLIPTSNASAGGGYSWPYYASQKLGAKTYNYAVGGAVCSNEIVYRYVDSLHGPYPSVIDYQVPAFKADVKYARDNRSTDFLRNRTPENSVYALWIGTNDLGNGGFLLDKQIQGKTIPDYIDCIWSVFDGIYSTGGRRFVLFTQAPLDLSPLYAAIPNGGSGNVNFWTNKTAYDTVEYEAKIKEYTTTVNKVYEYGVPFQLLVQKRWPGASFAILDTHQILSDIHDNPDKYLSKPAHVKDFYYTCPDPNSGDGCSASKDPLSSFLWYDSLHPSSRADEIIGTELAKAVAGKSSYATYYP
ncbi:carbohydrate esterase family 16 protein [Xylariaceae sp. FL0594]|nr:carbohydrate esterase family 16 protein [Xylariaceae sp. FL0594]